jgi:hypothetical protein
MPTRARVALKLLVTAMLVSPLVYEGAMQGKRLWSLSQTAAPAGRDVGGLLDIFKGPAQQAEAVQKQAAGVGEALLAVGQKPPKALAVLVPQDEPIVQTVTACIKDRNAVIEFFRICAIPPDDDPLGSKDRAVQSVKRLEPLMEKHAGPMWAAIHTADNLKRIAQGFKVASSDDKKKALESWGELVAQAKRDGLIKAEDHAAFDKAAFDFEFDAKAIVQNTKERLEQPLGINKTKLVDRAIERLVELLGQYSTGSKANPSMVTWINEKEKTLMPHLEFVKWHRVMDSSLPGEPNGKTEPEKVTAVLEELARLRLKGDLRPYSELYETRLRKFLAGYLPAELKLGENVIYVLKDKDTRKVLFRFEVPRNELTLFTQSGKEVVLTDSMRTDDKCCNEMTVNDAMDKGLIREDMYLEIKGKKKSGTFHGLEPTEKSKSAVAYNVCRNKNWKWDLPSLNALHDACPGDFRNHFKDTWIRIEAVQEGMKHLISLESLP